MQSPLLPWEVIERVISHAGDHPETLFSFSLTCRQLRPRALCLMVADADFKHRDQIFSFCDFLEGRPLLKPLVRSISVNPVHLAPFPLLHILPNLSVVYLVSPGNHGDDHSSEDGDSVEDEESAEDADPVDYSDNGHHGLQIPLLNTPIIFNRPTLTCCQRFGTHIRALHLVNLSFPTYLEFAQILLAFTSIRHLISVNTFVKAEGNRAHLDVVQRRLSDRLRLRTVDVDYPKYERQDFYNKPSVAALLLDSGLVQSTVETLTVRPYRSYGLPRLYGWPQLRTLVVKLLFNARDITDAIVFLKDFPSSTLKDVTVELQSAFMSSINDTLTGESSPGLLEELEEALLRFPRPRVVRLVDKLHEVNKSFWTRELAKRFPLLSQRGALTFASRTVLLGIGHDGGVWDIATSPDSKWAATASEDATIILWDTADGTMVHRWIAHSYEPVSCLAFSPDSRYLVSGGHDSTVKIWDFAQGARHVATLEGHTEIVTCCAWSPRGDTIASGSYDATVRLWDARTFDELRVLKHADMDSEYRVRRVAFSPDGRWLVSGSSHGYHVWSVDVSESSSPHKTFLVGRRCAYMAATFDPTSTRLLVAERDAVKLVCVETGEELAVLSGVTETWGVAFSPDGTLVATGFGGGMVKLWDARTGVEVLALEGHRSAVRQTRFSPSGKYVASASEDGTVRLWRTQPTSDIDEPCVAVFSEKDVLDVYHIAFSPDGETLWSGDEDGTVVMRRMRDIIPTGDEPRAS